MKLNWIEQGGKGSGRWIHISNGNEYHIEPATGGFIVTGPGGELGRAKTQKDAKELVEVHIATARGMAGALPV